MKKLISVILLSLATSAIAGDSYVRSFSTRTKVLPTVGTKAGASWATATVYNVQGAYAIGVGGQSWMVISTGTSHTAGSGPIGDGEFTDASVTWWHVYPKGTVRKQWFVQWISGGDVTVFQDSGNTNYAGYVIGSGKLAGVGESGNNVSQGEWYITTTGAVISVSEDSLVR